MRLRSAYKNPVVADVSPTTPFPTGFPNPALQEKHDRTNPINALLVHILFLSKSRGEDGGAASLRITVYCLCCLSRLQAAE